MGHARMAHTGFFGGDSRNLEIQKSRNLEPNRYKRVIAILLRFFEGVKPLAAGKPSRNRRAGVAGSSPGKPGDDAMSQGKCGEGGALQGISFPAGSLRWRKAGAQRLTTPPASLPCPPCFSGSAFRGLPVQRSREGGRRASALPLKNPVPLVYYALARLSCGWGANPHT